MNSMKYNKVAVGGTFDKFHDGHKKLLSTAFQIGNKVEIGVTSDEFGGLKGDIDSCEERIRNLKSFFSDKSNFVVIPLEDPYGTTIYDADFDAIFTKDKPIIFAFHGYGSLIHELAYNRHNQELHVHGYKEEGTITTPFDMRVQNELDRYHLVMDAIKYIPKLQNRGSRLVQWCKDKLVEHKNYIAEYGEDLEIVRNWKWE